jgi:hypothetical protein
MRYHGTIDDPLHGGHRLCEGKREVRIYDYADLNVSTFARMFDRRCRGYEGLGYTMDSPECHFEGPSRTTFVTHHTPDIQIRQKLLDIVHAAAWQIDVVGVFLSARNNSRLVVSG